MIKTIIKSEFLSICCGKIPYGEIYTSTKYFDEVGNPIRTGICSKCRDHATFLSDKEEQKLNKLNKLC